MDGIECLSLLDTGSQVTTISEGFVKRFMPDKKILPCTNLLSIEGAGGAAIPYLGYCEASMEDSSKSSVITAPLLITPDTCYSKNVPVIIGTNILHRWMSKVIDSSTSSPLVMAYRAIKRREQHLEKSGGIYGTAYLHRTTVLEPGEIALVDGSVRLTVPVTLSVALIEATGGRACTAPLLAPLDSLNILGCLLD